MNKARKNYQICGNIGNPPVPSAFIPGSWEKLVNVIKKRREMIVNFTAFGLDKRRENWYNMCIKNQQIAYLFKRAAGGNL